MPKFRVEYKETRTHVVTIEADDSDEAVNLVEQSQGEYVSDQFDSFELVDVSEVK